MKHRHVPSLNKLVGAELETPVVFHYVELGRGSHDYNTNDSGASISVTSRALFVDVAACPVTPMTKIEFTDGARAGLKVVVAIE